MTQTEHAAATGLILAVDTAADSVSAALIDATGGVLEHVEREKNKHTERLLPLVDAVLKERNVTVADCAAVAFGAGPGAFTGIRTACAAAQGLAWAVDRPVICVPTLTAAAVLFFREQPDVRRVLIALDARMHECYVQAFEAGHPDAPAALSEPAAVKPSEIGNLVCEFNCGAAAGSAFAVYPEATESAGCPVFAGLEVTSRGVALLARTMFMKGEVVTASLASPIYVRNRVALTIKERQAGEKL